MTFSRIAMIMAMAAEANPIIDRLKLSAQGQIYPQLPMQLYSGNLGNSSIHLIISGKCNRHGVDHIGTQAAVLNTHLAIDFLVPDIIINPGTAGGFKKDNVSIGDVYLGHPHVCFHDRRINLPGFKEYGIGYYPCFNSDEIAKVLELKTGVISSGNSLDYTPMDLEVMQSHNGIIKDMEAASVAWVSQLHGIPFIAIKAITDLIDGDVPTEEEFLKNLQKTSETLSEKTYQLLIHLTST
jgi:5'-methylthioadenosine nucleosidase